MKVNILCTGNFYLVAVLAASQRLYSAPDSTEGATFSKDGCEDSSEVCLLQLKSQTGFALEEQFASGFTENEHGRDSLLSMFFNSKLELFFSNSNMFSNLF